MKLRRRSAMRSMPVWRAASSISRSMVKIASGRPGAAVGAGGRRVGQHAWKWKSMADVVDAGLHPGADQQLDGDAGAGGIGAHVGQRLHAQRQDAAVGVERQFGTRALDVAAVVRSTGIPRCGRRPTSPGA
jgi:hypothetical protein